VVLSVVQHGIGDHNLVTDPARLAAVRTNHAGVIVGRARE